MFEKLLSVLPYNPGIAHQMSFYGRRMREEAGIRRVGLIFMVLTFMVQFFAVLSPPQVTSASDSNDLVAGGISSAADAREKCQSNTRGYMQILHYYGISCAAFDSAESLTIHASAQNYYSMGHNTSPGKDTPVNIPGAGTVYWRKLTTWGQESWQVLRVRDYQNKVFYIIFDCGNLVSVGIPPHNQLTQDVFTPGAGTALINPPVLPPPAPLPTPTPVPTPPAPPPPAPCPYNPALPASSLLCFEPCPYNNLLPVGDVGCKPCDKSLNNGDKLACVSVRKTASNVTAGIADANNTTAKAGDVITYTLYAENKGKAKIDSFTFQENLADVSDYADIIDLHGGSIDQYKVATWPSVSIDAGKTVTIQVTVKVKTPIPATAPSPTNPFHFDLTMTNVYGNTINIKLPPTPVSQVSTAAATLPNTGPGTGLAVAAGVMIIGAYFYSRSRLLARESSLAVQDTAGV